MTRRICILSFSKMFEVGKQWLGSEHKWTTGPVLGVKYFESWTEEDKEPLKESDISDLLRHAPPHIAPGKGSLQIFVVPRIGTGPADFPMSKLSFEEIVKEFDLHEKTLDVFRDYNGSALCGYVFSKKKSVRKLRIVMRSNVKGYLASIGVSLSYDFHFRVTRALLYGTKLLDGDRDVDERFDNIFETVKAHARRFPHLLSSPMFLPSLLVSECAERLQYCSAVQRTKTIGLEYRMGISCPEYIADYTVDEKESDLREKTEGDKQDTERLLSALGRQSLEADWLGRSCEAILDLAQFVKETMADLPAPKDYSSVSTASEISCMITYVIRKLRNNLQLIDRVNKNIHSQRGILLSRIAQEDNETNKEIARATVDMAFATVSDSMAMKILTSIAAFFLPPTVIAQIFSMSMFNWMATEPQDKIVSSKSWIYWAFAAPITLLVMFFAWLWLKLAKRKFERDHPQLLYAKGLPDPRPELCFPPLGSVLARHALA